MRTLHPINRNIKMLKKIIVVGYYGYDNLGDDLMLWCFLKEMSTKLPDVEISLLSKPSSNLDKICENFENVTLMILYYY